MTELRHWTCQTLLAVTVCGVLANPALGQTFPGFDSSTLTPLTGSSDWGLKIVVLNVGQADAILIFTPNGDTCLIDSGKFPSAGNQIADVLDSKTLNGVGTLKTVDLLFTTHYDQDHIGGLPRLVERGITIRKAYDQGLSKKRHMKTMYTKYVTAIGDPNDDYIQNAGEEQFVRHKIYFGQIERIGRDDQVEIRCVSVRGDTTGDLHDSDLDPADKPDTFNENPGSVALFVRLGEFEFYTAGDQTDNDWRSFPATEEAVLDSGAIPSGNDIDLIKVSHHGSDSSTSKALASKMLPEVAVISTKFIPNQRLPKKIVLRQFQDNRSYVLITGDGRSPQTDEYSDSPSTDEDNHPNFIVDDSAVFNNQGNVTVLVSKDGSRYTVSGGSFSRTFSARDIDNQR